MKKLFDSQSTGKVELSIRELGRTRRVVLDGKEKWTLGRKTPENSPDIPLRSDIAGRGHGEFLFMDGLLFYVDRGNVNGTFHNGKKISKGLKGRAAPVLLSDGDILRIDCEDSDRPDSRNVNITVRIHD